MCNFKPLEVVDRGSETQRQVVENVNKLIYQANIRANSVIAMLNPFKPDFTLSPSSTTSRELLLQFSTCSGRR